MKAMILAAGLGTRLRPLTDDRPKALVEVAGRTMLEITLARMRAFAIREVIVNAHHFAGMVADYLRANDNFGMRIEISREETLLDTGGGLKQAACFFQENSSGLDEPFILHNVDVVSTIDLRRMVQFHIDNQALATLAMQDRKSSRYLLFDQQLQLRGRKSGRDPEPEPLLPAESRALAFSGIHVISPRLLNLMVEEGAFSIIDCYLRLAQSKEKILAFQADEFAWHDLGTPDKLLQTERDLAKLALE